MVPRGVRSAPLAGISGGRDPRGCDADHTVTSMSNRPVRTLVASFDNADRMTEQDLDRLVSEHRAPLFRYVLRFTFGDRHLAEDIVQETLLRVWQRPKTLTTEHASIRPWLYTVARNLVRDHKRARMARPTEVYDVAAPPSPVATDEMDDALARHDMQRALARLSELHRAVLLECYYRGRRLADAADALGIPIGTVKSRMYYALRALRLVINELGIATQQNQEPGQSVQAGNELPCAS